MSTKKSGSSSDGRGSSAGQTGGMEMASNQAAATVESFGAAFEAAQALQSMQQQMMGRMVQRQLKAFEQLRTLRSPMDAVMVQVDLMTFTYQELVQLWSQVAGAAQSQTQQASGTASNAREDAPSTASAMNPMAINPMMQAWQTMLTPVLNGAGSQPR